MCGNHLVTVLLLLQLVETCDILNAVLLSQNATTTFLLNNATTVTDTIKDWQTDMQPEQCYRDDLRGTH